jgi:DNA-binding MarR family transcriptional regulator
VSQVLGTKGPAARARVAEMQLKVLIEFALAPSTTLREVARTLGYSISSVHKYVKELETHGLLERGTCDSCGSFCRRITPFGREALA